MNYNQKPENKKVPVWVKILLLVIIVSYARTIVLKEDTSNSVNNTSNSNYLYNSGATLDTREFNILISEENKDLETILTNYMSQKGYKYNIDYAGTLEIMNKLNESMQYDAIWAANSIWTYMVNTNTTTLTNSKAICLSPIVFGIKKSKAEELGFVGKQVYTEDIVKAIEQDKLKFAMSNPTTTNSGASAYLGMLYTLAGNPEVLTEDILNNPVTKSKLKTFFSGVQRTSGTEDYLEELFINGDYEAVFSYESSIIKINKKLESQGKEALYVVYPFDGVPFSDNPFVYVDRKDEQKAEIFASIQEYLLSEECKDLLAEKGRRTWYGGINNNANQSVFNPNWGINTSTYITPVKYPTSDVIRLALSIYQSRYRKPVHVVFCLDYSGSMEGEGYEELKNAMEFIFSDAASDSYIQFSEEDVIDVLLFSSDIINSAKSENGSQTDALLDVINRTPPMGGTAIYKAVIKGLDILSKENDNVRNRSIILMTDGYGNVGKFNDLKNKYERLNQDIPIYSIMFGDASSKQLEEIAGLSNGKVFDGKSDLEKAFKEVRGYN